MEWRETNKKSTRKLKKKNNLNKYTKKTQLSWRERDGEGSKTHIRTHSHVWNKYRTNVKMWFYIPAPSTSDGDDVDYLILFTFSWRRAGAELRGGVEQNVKYVTIMTAQSRSQYIQLSNCKSCCLHKVPIYIQ